MPGILSHSGYEVCGVCRVVVVSKYNPDRFKGSRGTSTTTTTTTRDPDRLRGSRGTSLVLSGLVWPCRVVSGLLLSGLVFSLVFSRAGMFVLVLSGLVFLS